MKSDSEKIPSSALPDTVSDVVGFPAEIQNQIRNSARHPGPVVPNPCVTIKNQLLEKSEESDFVSQNSVESLGAELVNRRELREKLLGLKMGQS